MKMLFVQAKSRTFLMPGKDALRELPRRIALFTTSQHLHELPRLKALLEAEGKEVTLFKGLHSRHEGQTLGCDVPELGSEFDCALFAGTGLFHPKALLMATDRPVFTLDPETGGIKPLDRELVQRMQGRRKAALKKFYSSERIGVLVTIKTGQERFLRALQLRERFPEKRFYILAFDTLEFPQLENFPFIECFVNTACPRIMDDHEKFGKPVLNLEDVTQERF